MKATDKYRQKYAKSLIEQGQPIKRLRTPAGHDDINRLCDTVDRMKMVIEDAILYLEDTDEVRMRAEQISNRLNMILLGL
jgi:hypothetical protein